MIADVAAVGAGAAFGAWLRWGLSTWLNPRAPTSRSARSRRT